MLRHVSLAALAAAIAIVITIIGFLAPAPIAPTLAQVRAAWRPSDVQLFDRNGEPVHQMRVDSHGRRLTWTALDDISPAMQRAAIASEDHRFHAHRGVDAVAVAGAIVRGLMGGRARGASTITMQLAALVDPNVARAGRRRGVAAKLRQMRDAWAIERRWTKREILEAYLNLVTYRGELQGIGAASWVMFGRAPHGIGAGEAAVMGALVRAPNAPQSVVARRAQVLAAAMGTNAPARDEISRAVGQAFAARPGAIPRVALAPHLAQRLILDGSREARRCTLDREVQRVAVETLRRQIAMVRDRHVDDGAVVVAENATGEVWAYVGSAGEGAPEFDSVRAARQPGSTLKPFLYALAIDRRLLTAASILEDTPLELSLERGLYRPMDYDRQFRGLVTMRTALAASLNVPAVRTAELAGLETFTEHLRQLGFDGLEQPGDYYGAALALGSADVNLWNLVNAYRTLANGGEYSALRIVPDDRVGPARRIYSGAAAWVISDVLADRASRSATFGLENSLATRYWSAVKTGTSKDMRDNWCVGYTDRFTVGVWVGNSSGAPMRDVTGVTGAAPVWIEVMNYLHDRFGSGAIARPAGVVAADVRFPNSIEPARREWFVAGTEPSAARARLDGTIVRIAAPAAGAIIALDPDIPPREQRIALAARGSRSGRRWRLDGRSLGAADRAVLWAPSRGTHKLEIVGRTGDPLDTVEFTVIGSAVLGAARGGAASASASGPIDR